MSTYYYNNTVPCICVFALQCKHLIYIIYIFTYMTQKRCRSRIVETISHASNARKLNMRCARTAHTHTVRFSRSCFKPLSNMFCAPAFARSTHVVHIYVKELQQHQHIRRNIHKVVQVFFKLQFFFTHCVLFVCVCAIFALHDFSAMKRII